MVVEKDSGRVPGRAPGSSRSRFDDGSGLQYLSRKSDPPLGFSHRGNFIGKGASSGGGPGGLNTGGRSPALRPRAGPRLLVVRLAPGPPPSHLRSLRSFGKNWRFGFCFVQF
jgi:hypothetical protein